MQIRATTARSTTIADDVSELVVFQRTPTWCLPRNDEPTPDDIREQFEAGGYVSTQCKRAGCSRFQGKSPDRLRVCFQGESLRVTEWQGDGQTKEGGEGIDFDVLHDPAANAQICAGLKMGIDASVKDPELAARLTRESSPRIVLSRASSGWGDARVEIR